MSNRIVALLILVASIAAIGFWTYYYFVRNVSEINVSVKWPKSATVSLLKAGANVLSAECPGNCSVTKIPPFEYELVVKADGFKTYSENVAVRTNDKIYRIVELERQVVTLPFRSDKKEAVAELRSKRAILSEEGAEEKGRQYYGQYRGLDYYSDSVPEFKLYARDSDGNETVPYSVGFWVEPTVAFGEDGILWISAEGASSLFDLMTWERSFPSFPSGISKIGRGLRPWTYVASDGKSAYAYDSVAKSVDKMELYTDYVPFIDGKIVALVRKGDERRSSLLNLWSAQYSYVFTDRSAWDRKVAYSTDRDIASLRAYSTGSVVLEFSDGSKEVLTNFE